MNLTARGNGTDAVGIQESARNTTEADAVGLHESPRFVAAGSLGAQVEQKKEKFTARVVVMGGSAGGRMMRDVWSSDDGGVTSAGSARGRGPSSTA